MSDVLSLSSGYPGWRNLVPHDGLLVDVQPAPVAIALSIEDAHKGSSWLLAVFFGQDMEGADHQASLQKALQRAIPP